MGTFTPWFPDPGSYIRYRDWRKSDGAIKYRKLTWRRGPLKYPKRLTALAAATKRNSPLTLDELNPSEDKKHLYLAYVGVKPGFLWYIYHPYDIKNLKWDENIIDIQEDMVANLTYEASPYEYPTYSIGIERDRYPSFQPYNISGETKTPELIIIASMYKVVEQGELSSEELSRLESGALRSHPWDFGGEL